MKFICKGCVILLAFLMVILSAAGILIHHIVRWVAEIVMGLLVWINDVGFANLIFSIVSLGNIEGRTEQGNDDE